MCGGRETARMKNFLASNTQPPLILGGENMCVISLADLWDDMMPLLAVLGNACGLRHVID